MEHFCTLFDLGFLPQGLALHASLRRHCPDSLLWVLCMDAGAEMALRSLRLPGMEILTLAEVETEALLSVKPGRSRGEYCWTLTSSLLLHLLESHPDLERATYLDADLWFLSTPRRLLEILDGSRAHALLTPHDYDPEHDQSVQSGRYCVQFVPVRNTPEGLRILRWWRDRCVEWCFARQEPGRFGDQKYLDEWIPLFGDTAFELPDPGLTLAPWNLRHNNHRLSEAVFFHFHNLRIHEGWKACLWRHYHVGRQAEEAIYSPYLRDLGRVRSLLEDAGIAPRLGAPPSRRLPDLWRRFHRSAFRLERWADIDRDRTTPVRIPG